MTGSAPNTVRIEYLIVVRRGSSASAFDIASDALAEALEEHWEEGAAKRVGEFIREEFSREAGPLDPATGAATGPTLFGFQIELTDEVQSPVLIVQDVTEALRREQEIEHVLKFHDSLLEENNRELAAELFSLEMRLRRAASLVYLNAYGSGYYDLLRNDALGTDGHVRKHMPDENALRAQAENEFFHLLFNHYGVLNSLREKRQIDDLIKLLGSCGDFAALQRELQRQPIEDPDDGAFLNQIKRNLDSVEKVRNCVMHNRAPTEDEVASYRKAQGALDKAMNDLFERWAPEPDGTFWESEAREAVEYALENAEWNAEAKTVTVCDPLIDDGHELTATTREELADHLCNIAETSFYAYCARDDGEYVAECDGPGIAADSLGKYGDRLDVVFGAK